MNLDYRICTVPLVDAIDGDTYVFSPQAGGDDNGFARGAWDWDLLWKRIPLTKREKVRQINDKIGFGTLRTTFLVLPMSHKL